MNWNRMMKMLMGLDSEERSIGLAMQLAGEICRLGRWQMTGLRHEERPAYAPSPTKEESWEYLIYFDNEAQARKFAMAFEALLREYDAGALGDAE